MKTLLLMLSILMVPACGQPQGTVNGVPIPSRAFSTGGLQTQAEVAWRLKSKRPIEKEDMAAIERSVQAQRCNKLKSAISGVLQEEVMKNMAITVTPADIAEFQKTSNIKLPDPQAEARQKHEYAAAVLTALDAQLNKHEDPQSVYDKYLKTHGITEQAWSVQLLLGQTPEGKQSLINQLNMTPETVAQAAKNFDCSYQVKLKKMKERIDEQISLSDPKFKQYLAEFHQAADQNGNLNGGMPGDHLEYLQVQRQAYWNDVYRKAQVVINDPTMQNCDLSEFGVRRN
uniref:Transcriptional regulator, Fis family n=1 Tax=Solibacter usitatus (strain Ellin6076) TaxID=234267 RepID=Q027Q1_SOLUE